MSKEVDLDFTNLPEFWIVSDIQNETEFVTDYVANGSFASLAENVKYNHQPDYAVLIRLTDFNNGFVGDFVYVDENAYNFLNKSKLYGGEIIISNVGAYSGTTFLAPNLNRPMTLGPNSIMMNFKNGNGFYYYWFRSPIGKFLLDGIISGSAQPKFNKTTFRKLKIPVPPLPEQKAIAFVLSSLDDKIDLLHRQNKTLEAMAETLFRQWFVEETQDVWNEKELKDILEFVVDNRGKTAPTSETGIPLIATNCIKNNNIFPTYEKIRYISEETYNNWFRSHPEPGDLIFVNKGTPGCVNLAPNPVDFCIAQDMIALRVNKNYVSNYYLFLFLRSEDIQNQIINSSVGTTIPHLKKTDLLSFKIIIPDNYKLNKFNKMVESFFLKMNSNLKQIRTLETLRDTLLPKLMSGEIRVTV